MRKNSNWTNSRMYEHQNKHNKKKKTKNYSNIQMKRKCDNVTAQTLNPAGKFNGSGDYFLVSQQKRRSEQDQRFPSVFNEELNDGWSRMVTSK